MICPKCNNVIEQGSSFCTNCGFNLVNDSTNLQEQPVLVNSNQNQDNIETLTDTSLVNDSSNQNIGQINDVGFNQNNQSIPVNEMNANNQSVQVNGINQNMQPSMPMNNMSNVSSTNNNMGNMNNMANMGNMNFAPAGNGYAAAKTNSNTSIIIIVVVIALVAIGICYFMSTKNASSDKKTSNNSTESTVAVNNNEVTVNGLTGNVPKNWSFVSGEEAGDSSYDGAFVNDEMNSFTFIVAEKTASFAAVKQNINAFKANLEASGLTDLNYNIDKKNGVEYILFEGLYSGKNYHVFVKSNTVGILCSEGFHSSASDLNTIVDFDISLKSSTGTRSMSGIKSPNFSSIILGK